MDKSTHAAPDRLPVSLHQSPGREILDNTITEYLTLLRRQPAFCGTVEQQENLIKHVVRGQDLIKLIAQERLKITREIDHQKQEWIDLEKKLTAPILAAIQPLKDAVDHYNREVLRLQEQEAQAAQTTLPDDAETVDWLSPDISHSSLPKGVQMKWTFEITDPNQVPNGYWVIDEGAIKAEVAQGVRAIPGVRIYQEAISTFRA